MEAAVFDPLGGPIGVEIVCDPNRNGSYTVILWEANSNDVVKKYPGNFLNTQDDEYALPGPNSSHNGRLVEGIVVVAIPEGVGPSDVQLIVTQDNLELARDERSVPPGSPGEIVDLFVELKSK